MFKPKRGYRCLGWSPDGDLVLFVYKGKEPPSMCRDGVWYCFIWDRKTDSRIQFPTLNDAPHAFWKCVVMPTHPYRVYLLRTIGTSYDWAEPSSHHWQTDRYPHNTRLVNNNQDAVVYKPRGDTNSTTAGLILVANNGELYTPETQLDMRSPNLNNLPAYERRLVSLYNQEEVPNAECFLLERKQQCTWEVWEVDTSRRVFRRAHDLSGLTVFLTFDYSIAYRSGSELERNCIYFESLENIYLFRLDDQSLSIVPNKFYYRFPFCLRPITDSGMPYLKFINYKDNQQSTVVVTSDETADDGSIESSCSNSDERCDLAVEDDIYCKLSDDLHRLIADLLPCRMDYANFRMVSRNLSRVPAICWQPDFSNSASIKLPWLMLAGEKDQHTPFIDPTCSMRYFISTQELLGCKIRYSNDGWLLVTRGMRTIFFFEPISKTKIPLVDLPQDFCIDGISFSSSPSSPSDWVIIATTPETDDATYLRQGYKEWIIISHVIESFPCGCSPIFHNDNLYILNQDWSLQRLSFMSARIGMHGTILSYDKPFNKFSNDRRGFLVSCGGNLYIVVVGLLGEFIKVFKLQEGSSECLDVKDIGNFSIFISQTSCFAIPVNEAARQNTINFPLFEENKHVYYKLDEGVFKMSDGSESTVDMYQRKELFNGTWLQPKAVKAYR